jgi:hypothetical protein
MVVVRVSHEMDYKERDPGIWGMEKIWQDRSDSTDKEQKEWRKTGDMFKMAQKATSLSSCKTSCGHPGKFKKKLKYE